MRNLLLILSLICFFSSLNAQYKISHLIQSPNNSLSASDNQTMIKEAEFLLPQGNNGKTEKKENRGRAILYSLLVPGLGEMSLGKKKQGLVFLGAEVSFLTGYIFSKYYENRTIDDYQNLAYQYAGVRQNKQYSEEFWIAVNNYDNVFDNNEQELINRNINGVYDVKDYYWDWQSPSYLNKYRKLRSKATSLRNLSKSLTMTFFVNRILSVVNVIRINRASQRQSVSWNLNYQNNGDDVAVKLNISKSF